MDGDSSLRAFASILLIVGNGLFVAAEYGLVGARRSKIEALAKRGGGSAKLLLASLHDLSRYVAGIQIAITMFGIGIGAITEPLVTHWLARMLGPWAAGGFSVFVSLLMVTFVFVVIGELVPKYLALQRAEKVALALIRPLRLVVLFLNPLVWLVQHAGSLVLRLFRVKMDLGSSDTVSKEELALLVKAGSDEGMIEEEHAQVISKALRFDILDAKDIMIHRLDIKWLDVETPKEELFQTIAQAPHSRYPVCRGDIDDMVGLLYLQDVIKHWREEEFSLENLLRPVEAVPENLALNKIVGRMREAKSQILIVMDEYGGTSGLITLEDVVEEVFGELEDQMESERPPIEHVGKSRLSARADVRFDELLHFLGKDSNGVMNTETLATLLVRGLDRVPKLGDAVDIPIGTLRVENMARRRITRVALQLKDASTEP